MIRYKSNFFHEIGFIPWISLLCFFIPVSLNAEIITITGYAQGTTYQVKYVDQSKRNFRTQIEKLLADFDKSLSLYREDSELSVFNRSHAIRFTTPYFYPVLQKSYEIYKATDGLFDPTVSPLIKAYGFGPEGRKEAGVNLDSIMQFVGFDKVNFDSLSVSKKVDPVSLDFNAIAQGYSVDLICKFLEEREIYSYLVEVGGELRGKGVKPDGNHWVVGISDPIKPSQLAATVVIDDLAMATSGNYRNRYQKDGITYTHIVNPKTGFPGVSDILSVTVFATDAMTADGYATALSIMGIEGLKQWLKKHPGLDVFAVFSKEDGSHAVFISEGIRPFVKLRE